MCEEREREMESDGKCVEIEKRKGVCFEIERGSLRGERKR